MAVEWRVLACVAVAVCLLSGASLSSATLEDAERATETAGVTLDVSLSAQPVFNTGQPTLAGAATIANALSGLNAAGTALTSGLGNPLANIGNAIAGQTNPLANIGNALAGQTNPLANIGNAITTATQLPTTTVITAPGNALTNGIGNALSRIASAPTRAPIVTLPAITGIRGANQFRP